MPLEGHTTDCDCGCCDVEEEPQVKAPMKCVCPSCGKEMPLPAGSTVSGPAYPCPSCGAKMQPAT
jgi:transposase-like protein